MQDSTLNQDTAAAIQSVATDYSELLDYSKDLVGSMRIRTYVKSRTIYRLNVFSALYQRSRGLIVLTKADQASVAGLVLRSMWELLANHDFMAIDRGNFHIELLRALEASQQEKNWTGIQQLRAQYPLAETWRATLSDSTISAKIALYRSSKAKFEAKNANTQLNQFRTLYQRLKVVDDHLVGINPNHKAINQFDYRTVYSLLSDDVHATIYGTINNTRISSSGSIYVRLDEGGLKGLRNLSTGYLIMYNFLRAMNHTFRLGQANGLKQFKTKLPEHDKLYSDLEARHSV